MRTRTSSIVKAPEPSRPKSDPAYRPGGTQRGGTQRGGTRTGAGRPPFLRPEERLDDAAYISLTSKEKTDFEELARKRGLTLSFFLRERLGLSTTSSISRAGEGRK